MRSICLFIWFAATIAIADDQFRPKIVANPAASYLAEHDYVNLPYRYAEFHEDFNADGMEDVAYTNGADAGTGGAGWEIYLRRADGKYLDVGLIAFKSWNFRIERIKKGVTRIYAYLHGGGGGGSITEYRLSNDGIKEIKTESVTLTDDPKDKTMQRFDKLFKNAPDQKEILYTKEELKSKVSRE